MITVKYPLKFTPSANFINYCFNFLAFRAVHIDTAYDMLYYLLNLLEAEKLLQTETARKRVRGEKNSETTASDVVVFARFNDEPMGQPIEPVFDGIMDVSLYVENIRKGLLQEFTTVDSRKLSELTRFIATKLACKMTELDKFTGTMIVHDSEQSPYIQTDIRKESELTVFTGAGSRYFAEKQRLITPNQVYNTSVPVHAILTDKVPFIPTAEIQALSVVDSARKIADMQVFMSPGRVADTVLIDLFVNPNYVAKEILIDRFLNPRHIDLYTELQSFVDTYKVTPEILLDKFADSKLIEYIPEIEVMDTTSTGLVIPKAVLHKQERSMVIHRAERLIDSLSHRPDELLGLIMDLPVSSRLSLGGVMEKTSFAEVYTGKSLPPIMYSIAKSAGMSSDEIVKLDDVTAFIGDATVMVPLLSDLIKQGGNETIELIDADVSFGEAEVLGSLSPAVIYTDDANISNVSLVTSGLRLVGEQLFVVNTFQATSPEGVTELSVLSEVPINHAVDYCSTISKYVDETPAMLIEQIKAGTTIKGIGAPLKIDAFSKCQVLDGDILVVTEGDGDVRTLCGRAVELSTAALHDYKQGVISDDDAVVFTTVNEAETTGTAGTEFHTVAEGDKFNEHEAIATTVFDSGGKEVAVFMNSTTVHFADDLEIEAGRFTTESDGTSIDVERANHHRDMEGISTPTDRASHRHVVEGVLQHGEHGSFITEFRGTLHTIEGGAFRRVMVATATAIDRAIFRRVVNAITEKIDRAKSSKEYAGRMFDEDTGLWRKVFNAVDGKPSTATFTAVEYGKNTLQEMGRRISESLFGVDVLNAESQYVGKKFEAREMEPPDRSHYVAKEYDGRKLTEVEWGHWEKEADAGDVGGANNSIMIPTTLKGAPMAPPDAALHREVIRDGSAVESSSFGHMIMQSSNGVMLCKSDWGTTRGKQYWATLISESLADTSYKDYRGDILKMSLCRPIDQHVYDSERLPMTLVNHPNIKDGEVLELENTNLKQKVFQADHERGADVSKVDPDIEALVEHKFGGPVTPAVVDGGMPEKIYHLKKRKKKVDILIAGARPDGPPPEEEPKKKIWLIGGRNNLYSMFQWKKTR